jgi:hypothetical protein
LGERVITDTTLSILEEELNHFDPQVRLEALEQIAQYSDAGKLAVAPLQSVANMHCHTFFSYNAFGYSPSALAWLAKKNGYQLLGIVDFDVLDGVDEFLDACDLLGVCGSSGLETRNYLPEYANFEINSPGEPGVYYNMGIGFSTGQVPAEAKAILADLSVRSDKRNRLIIDRVNDFLDPIQINYDSDVLPLTPAGNPTERHIVLAYVRRVESEITEPPTFWADKLGLPLSQTIALVQNPPNFQNTIRSKLMKKGGVGYIQPNPDSFPIADQLYKLTSLSGALPCATWLDGLSEGEQVFPEILELLISKGAVALNLVPDRNWNIPDSLLREKKLQKLTEVVSLSERMDLPLNIGTEMNTYGNKLVDSFDAPELEPFRQAFLDGAFFVYGHTILQRSVGLGYQSEWAKAFFPSRSARNDFFTKAGYSIPPGRSGLKKLKKINKQSLPGEILAAFKERKNINVRTSG